MPRPVLIVGDVQGDFERLTSALGGHPEDEVDTIFLGDFFQGGRPGAAGGHRAARIAMDRAHTRAILGNHDLFLLAMLEMERGISIDWRAGNGMSLREIWLTRRGDWADLQAVAQDSEVETWLRGLPLMLRLSDGTLVQHTDDDSAAEVGDSVEAVNRLARAALGEPAGLLEILRLTIGRHAFDDVDRLDRYLQHFGGRRLVHGHTPHWGSLPDTRHGGRIIGFDGRFSRFWSREAGEKHGPLAATVGLLPPLADL